MRLWVGKGFVYILGLEEEEEEEDLFADINGILGAGSDRVGMIMVGKGAGHFVYGLHPG